MSAPAGETGRIGRALGRLAGGGAELLPQGRLSGPMPWVIAIMVALTVIASGAGLALRNAADAARAELSGGLTVQIIEAHPETRDAQARAALARLRSLPGVQGARVVPAAEVDALVEPWLGDARVGEDAIPVPALIDARLAGKATPQRIAAIGAQLRAVAPAARVDAQSAWLGPVFSAIQSLQWLALALVALLGIATAAAVLLTVRSGLGSHRATLEVVHLLGGTDAQIAGVFQRSIGYGAALGGVFGLAGGSLVVLFLGERFGALGAGLARGGALGLTDWLVLAAIPFAGVALAMLTARITVMRTLRQML